MKGDNYWCMKDCSVKDEIYFAISSISAEFVTSLLWLNLKKLTKLNYLSRFRNRKVNLWQSFEKAMHSKSISDSSFSYPWYSTIYQHPSTACRNQKPKAVRQTSKGKRSSSLSASHFLLITLGASHLLGIIHYASRSSSHSISGNVVLR